MNFIELIDVSKTFIKKTGKDISKVECLDNLNLTIERNEFLVLLGPSGCGKTTLLRMIDGLIEPTKGEILIKNKKVEGPGIDRSMIFQTFNLLPWRNTMENTEFGLEIQGVSKAERKRIAQKFIDLVGLNGFESHYPHELSGGMQQRVGLARALTTDPEILLMDEPFGYLDALTRLELQDELLKIWSKTKKTCVFVTHDLDESIYLGDRIVLLSKRPAKIREIFNVDTLPRPRWDHDTRGSKEFFELKARIWKKLREELLN